MPLILALCVITRTSDHAKSHLIKILTLCLCAN